MIRSKYPALYCYGDRQTFLDGEAATTASTEERIRSVWPFLCRKVLAFAKTLKSRERVNFDPEDVLIELWATLAQKDGSWTPDRGRYISFAGVIIERELCSIRDRSRTVESPRNSTCRLRQYAAEEEAGELTERRRKTFGDIKRTGGVSALGETAFALTAQEDEPIAVLVDQEETDAIREIVRAALERLGASETEVVRRLAGLDGREPQTVPEIARDLALSEAEVRRLRSAAFRTLRASLASWLPAVDPERN